MAGTAADPVGDVANATQKVADGAWGTTKNVVRSTYNYVVKPAGLAYGVLSLYSGLDGGVGALANIGTEGASRIDMLKVPAEGFMEFTSDIADVASWLSEKGANGLKKLAENEVAVNDASFFDPVELTA